MNEWCVIVWHALIQALLPKLYNTQKSAVPSTPQTPGSLFEQFLDLSKTCWCQMQCRQPIVVLSQILVVPGNKLLQDTSVNCYKYNITHLVDLPYLLEIISQIINMYITTLPQFQTVHQLVITSNYNMLVTFSNYKSY